MSYIEILIKFIKQHDTEAYATPRNTIYALEKYTINGVYGEQWIELDADLRDVRNWLGY